MPAVWGRRAVSFKKPAARGVLDEVDLTALDLGGLGHHAVGLAAVGLAADRTRHVGRMAALQVLKESLPGPASSIRIAVALKACAWADDLAAEIRELSAAAPDVDQIVVVLPDQEGQADGKVIVRADLEAISQLWTI